LIEALQQAAPESQYVSQLTPIAFLAYRQAGQTEKAVAIAEEAAANNKATDDMYLVAADYYFNKKDATKTLDYCNKLVKMLATEPAPKGVSPADWEKKKKMSITENPVLQAGALFHLGVANFQLGNKSGDEKRILDAFNFTKRCAAMKSPFQAQARKNLAAIQTQYRIK